MVPTSPSNPLPAIRLSWLSSRLRGPTLLRRGLPIIVATLLGRPVGYIRVAMQAWLSGAILGGLPFYGTAHLLNRFLCDTRYHGSSCGAP